MGRHRTPSFGSHAVKMSLTKARRVNMSFTKVHPTSSGIISRTGRRHTIRK
jgi:hypothetical protein